MAGFPKLGQYCLSFLGEDVVCTAAAAGVTTGGEIKNPITRAKAIEVTNTVVLICIRLIAVNFPVIIE